MRSWSGQFSGTLALKGLLLLLTGFKLSFLTFGNRTQSSSVNSPFFYLLWFRDSSSDLTMVIGAMYAAVLFVGINNCSTVQPIVAVERTVFYRERAAGMYSALPYAMAQVREGFITYPSEMDKSFFFPFSFDEKCD